MSEREPTDDDRERAGDVDEPDEAGIAGAPDAEPGGLGHTPAPPD